MSLFNVEQAGYCRYQVEAIEHRQRRFKKEVTSPLDKVVIKFEYRDEHRRHCNIEIELESTDGVSLDGETVEKLMAVADAHKEKVRKEMDELLDYYMLERKRCREQEATNALQASNEEQINTGCLPVSEPASNVLAFTAASDSDSQL